MVRRLMSDWVHGGLLYGILLLLCTPISANLFWMFFFDPPQNRHPEWSASQICRVKRVPGHHL